MSRRRLITAALLAPLVAVLVFWAGSLIIVASEQAEPLSTRELVRGGLHILFFFLFFGFPAALLASAALAWPGYLWLEARGWLRRMPVAVGATLAGAVAVPLVWRFLWGANETRAQEWLGLAGLGAVTGLAAGLTFGLVALPRPPRPAASRHTPGAG